MLTTYELYGLLGELVGLHPEHEVPCIEDFAVIFDAVAPQSELSEKLLEIERAKSYKEIRAILEKFAMANLRGKTIVLDIPKHGKEKIKIYYPFVSHLKLVIRDDESRSLKRQKLIAKRLLIAAANIDKIAAARDRTQEVPSDKNRHSGNTFKYSLIRKFRTKEAGTFQVMLGIMVVGSNREEHAHYLYQSDDPKLAQRLSDLRRAGHKFHKTGRIRFSVEG